MPNKQLIKAKGDSRNQLTSGRAGLFLEKRKWFRGSWLSESMVTTTNWFPNHL